MSAAKKKPAKKPTTKPTKKPTTKPATKPTTKPAKKPVKKPAKKPTQPVVTKPAETPTTSAAPIGERAMNIVARLTSSPDVKAVFKDLGLSMPKKIIDVAAPSQGIHIRVTVAKGASSSHGIGGVTFHRAGHTDHMLAVGPETFAGYVGPLPKGITFDDTWTSLVQKLGPTERDDDDDFAQWRFEQEDRTLTVNFSGPDGKAIVSVTWSLIGRMGVFKWLEG